MKLINIGCEPISKPNARQAEVFAGGVLPTLRRKWGKVPAGEARVATRDLMGLDDQSLRTAWTRLHAEATTGAAYTVRGWYQTLYRDALRGKVIADIGSGLGFDGITFARAGAQVVFADIVEENVALLRRLCGLFDVDTADFLYVDDLGALGALPEALDAVWCQGSMINAPFDFAREEARFLVDRLSIGGRWIELAYPKERWRREGALPFHEWGKRTDGEETPWVEWVDLARLQDRLSPARFDVVLSFNFHHDDFNWFDLVRTA